MKAVYRIFETDWGWCAAAETRWGLCAFVLPAGSSGEAEELALKLIRGNGKKVQEGFDELIDLVRRYFRRERVEFDLPLDLSYGTPFMRRVWRATRLIPYGETRTYAWVARKAGSPRAFRAVGMALARNPLPLIVPCHRVIRSDGSLGGFTAPGGVRLKMKLLRHELIESLQQVC